MSDRDRPDPQTAGKDAHWAREPLGLWWGAPRTWAPPEAAFCRFEFSSRGDRVGGVLAWPRASARPPATVLVASDERTALGAERLPASVRALLERGLAAAALGLPLLGDRASPKLSALLHRALQRAGPEPAAPRLAELLEGAAEQARFDLERARLALGRGAPVAAERFALLAVGAGAALVEPVLEALAALRWVALVPGAAGARAGGQERPAPQVPGLEIRIESELDRAADWLAQRLREPAG